MPKCNIYLIWLNIYKLVREIEASENASKKKQKGLYEEVMPVSRSVHAVREQTRFEAGKAMVLLVIAVLAIVICHLLLLTVFVVRGTEKCPKERASTPATLAVTSWQEWNRMLIAWHNLAEKGKWIYLSLSYIFPLPQASKNEGILELEELKKKLQVEIVKTSKN